MWCGLKTSERWGGEAKEEHESETTRKHGISNFFFTFCTHMKPHHFQDNLCLSIMFNFSCHGALFCVQPRLVRFFLRERPNNKWFYRQQFVSAWEKTRNTCGSVAPNIFHSRRSSILSLLSFSLLLFLHKCFGSRGKIIEETHRKP